MTRSELIELLHQQFHQLTTKDIELSVRVILDGMVQTMAMGGRI